jgi:hypothetical protein
VDAHADLRATVGAYEEPLRVRAVAYEFPFVDLGGVGWWRDVRDGDGFGRWWSLAR